jgi:hypothetical protein
MSKVDLKTVQELMGHKAIAMTAPVCPSRPGSQVAGVEDSGMSRIGSGTKWLYFGYQGKLTTRGQEE